MPDAWTRAKNRADPSKGLPADRENANVQEAISEDVGDGHFAKLDANLQSLSSKALRLYLPSDEPDDAEIHLIETSTAPLSNHGFQAYQMQLMQLEQQNKRRLLMARDERDLGNGVSNEEYFKNAESARVDIDSHGPTEFTSQSLFGPNSSSALIGANDICTTPPLKRKRTVRQNLEARLVRSRRTISLEVTPSPKAGAKLAEPIQRPGA